MNFGNGIVQNLIEDERFQTNDHQNFIRANRIVDFYGMCTTPGVFNDANITALLQCALPIFST